MPRPSPISKEQELELVQLYVSGISRNALALQFGTSRGFVNWSLRRHGIKARTLQEAVLPDLNHHAFASAETNPDASYWVGFLMADGCVSHPPNRGSPHIIVALSSKDEAHIVSLHHFLGAKVSIQRTPAKMGSRFPSGEMVRLDVVSAQLASDLSRYGVVPRKTSTATVSELLASNRDFWRGVVDGDGSIHIQSRLHYKPRPVLQLTGSHSLISQFSTFAKSSVGSVSGPTVSKGSYAHALTCGPAVRMIRLLYGDCTVALPRKLATAQEVMTRFPD